MREVEVSRSAKSSAVMLKARMTAIIQNNTFPREGRGFGVLDTELIGLLLSNTYKILCPSYVPTIPHRPS